MDLSKPKTLTPMFTAFFMAISINCAANEKRVNTKKASSPKKELISKKEALTVGVLLPMSGTLESSGKSAYQGLELALSELKRS